MCRLHKFRGAGGSAPGSIDARQHSNPCFPDAVHPSARQFIQMIGRGRYYAVQGPDRALDERDRASGRAASSDRSDRGLRSSHCRSNSSIRPGKPLWGPGRRRRPGHPLRKAARVGRRDPARPARSPAPRGRPPARPPAGGVRRRSPAARSARAAGPWRSASPRAHAPRR